MFTGIVRAVGTLASVTPGAEDARLEFRAQGELMKGAREGDSMCVSGVCLTMLEPDSQGFSADVSTETLDRTTAGRWQAGHRVNLEPALAATDRFGGHLVSGHVDGVASVSSRETDGRSQRLAFELPPGLAKYVARKGSICVDGVSLTVNAVAGASFEVSIIPHTLEVTTLGALRPGDAVNVEVDLLARHIERLLTEAGREGAS